MSIRHQSAGGRTSAKSDVLNKINGKLGMWVLRIMVEMGSGQPDSIKAMLDLAPADLALLGTAHFTGPSCLLFACFGARLGFRATRACHLQCGLLLSFLL